ncbi:VPA1269 family protein [Paraburkholderia sp. DGU8]|uniref:VPA1269 family protein n=1 Tax=Paraburkholderia sp. DGU8 TaxID=3161997 RepID=UPI003467B2FC
MSSILEFESFSGGVVRLNPSNRHQILHIPNRLTLNKLVEEFKSLHLLWLRRYLLSPAGDSNDIFGAGAVKIRTKSDTGERWSATLTRLSIEKLPADAWATLDHVPPLENGTIATKLFNASDSDKRIFVEAAIGANIESIAVVLREEYKDRLIYPWLYQANENIDNPEKFLSSLIERAAFERERPREGRNFLLNPMASLFLFWLSQKGIVLCPIVKPMFIGENIGLKLHLTSSVASQTLKTILVAYEKTTEKYTKEWRERLEFCYEIVIASSTFRTSDDLSLEFFEKIYEIIDDTFAPAVADKLSKIYRPLRDSLNQRELPTFRPVRKSNPPLESPFDWTKLSIDGHPRSTFPRNLKSSYQPRPDIIVWADRFTKYLVRLQIKSTGNVVSSLQTFLCWLAESERKISHPGELRREHINDNSNIKESRCFRAFLARLEITPESANGHILRLTWAMESIIEEDSLQIANPFSVRFDSFKVAFARGKTPRRPLGRELLTYLKDFNRRNDYSFSKGFESHYRQALNANGQYENVWFPGLAVLIDLLLELPLRSFQARYLDTGEGDEEVVVFDKKSIRAVPNTLSTSVKKRNESLFYIFELADGTPSLGLYINTNKTSVDRETGYEIAWCSDELRDSLSLLRSWQVENNPVARPIPCMEKHEFEITKNPEVIDSLKTTFSMFRDPADPAGWPISRDRLFDYWSSLLAAVEDELASAGRDIRLTEAKEVSKGPNKKPVVKRLAIYDVHTLRVSGISALIEAGMPPDLVQQVAGHATLVMTLYYNKIKAWKLNETFSRALDKLSSDLDNIDGLNEADFEQLASFLTNSRSEEDAIGLSLLTERMGHGDGTIEVFTHGICPAGECATGGEFQNQAVGYGPVPRPLACPLCRYRLTGPMFLVGLVLNANRLMHELRTKGKEIAAANEERARLEDAHKPTHAVKARIEALYRETDIVATEWAAEVQYIHTVEKMVDRYLDEERDSQGEQPVIVTGLAKKAVESQIVHNSELGLLQSLVEGANLWPGFKPTAAISEHREFLNEVLTASGLDPFLLKLRGELRDKAALLLGRTLASLVPSDQHENLRLTSDALDNYPVVASVISDIRTRALTFDGAAENFSVEPSLLTEDTK